VIEQFAQWAGIEPTPEVTASLRDAWTLHPYTVDGEIRAIAAMSGSEIHFAISPQWRHRVITRQRTRDFLRPLFDAYGFLTTRSEPDEKHERFLTRIGFDMTYFDGKYRHYMMAALPFKEN
jgi:hypothetical protein